MSLHQTTTPVGIEEYLIHKEYLSDRIILYIPENLEELFKHGKKKLYSDQYHVLTRISKQSYSEEIESILREAEQRCHDLLNENREGLDALAQSLLVKETLDSNDVHELLGIPKTGRDDHKDLTPGETNEDVPALQNFSKSENL